ncbi:Vacuolar protein sortingassociated protein 18 -like protein, partial [Caligus rogercresseyi]
GELITAVGWSGKESGPLLMGTAPGSIIETELDMKGNEKYWKKILELGGSQRITGLEYHRTPRSTKYFIIASTMNRIYQFVGCISEDEEGVLPIQFQGVQLPTFTKLPLRLRLFLSLRRKRGLPKATLPLFPKTFGWMSSSGIYTGGVSPFHTSSDEGVLTDAKLLPFPDTSSIRGNNGSQLPPPKWFLLTEYHCVLGYESLIRVLSLLDERVIFEDEIDDATGTLNGLARDPVTGIIYSYSDYGISKYKVVSEERHAWRIHLGGKKFDEAKASLSKSDPHYSLKINEILRLEADAFYDMGRYRDSALTYAKTMASFEEVVLKFKIESLRASDTTQMTMVVVWIIEIYLNQINQVRDALSRNEKPKQRTDLSNELASLNKEFVVFVSTPKISSTIFLNRGTIYELLSSHGDVNNLVTLSLMNKDYESAVKYKIQLGEYKSALGILESQKLASSFYIHGSSFLREVPKDFVETLKRLGSIIDPHQIIPCMIAVTEEGSVPRVEEEVINYLEFVLEEFKSKDASVHNYLLSLYATHHVDRLGPYITSFGVEDIPYDVKYALKLCDNRKELVSEMIFLFCILGELESAVDLALVEADIEEAKEVLKFTRDEDMMKLIWLKIAQHVVQEKNDIKSAMEFLQQTDLVKIEDILPFFDDFVTIDHFREAICQSLHDYSTHISSLKSEMEEANQSAEKIRSEVREFKNKYAFVRGNDSCASCSDFLLCRPFHLFICGHKFHTDCLTKGVLPHLSSAKRKKVEQLQFEVLRANNNNNNGMSNEDNVSEASRSSSEAPSLDSKGPKLSKKDQLLSELDDLIAAECLFCGDIMVKMMDQPFFEDEDFDKVLKEWL